ncbi:MAG TPA: STAS domain-containing protein [Rhodanobacteraceae bacterium]|nr:STAS domain-containing protein [Rhodanobacteraceae bacterium]
MAGAGKRKKACDCRVQLGEALVIGVAAELHAQLGEALIRPEPVVLDAAAVARVDTAGLQLLQAFVQARDEGAGAWRWANVGEILHAAAGQLGLQRMLKLPDVAPTAD